MSEHTGWHALQRKLKAVLSPDEHKERLTFLSTIKGRYSGDFSTSSLSKSELDRLSAYADRARE